MSKIDSETGIQFPLRLTSGESTRDLLGTGCRIKAINSGEIKIFAIGIYAEREGVNALLSKYKNFNANDLIKNNSFFTDFINSNSLKQYRCVLCRTLSTKNLTDGLMGMFRSRITDNVQWEEVENLLNSSLSGVVGPLEEGTVLFWSASPTGLLELSIDGSFQSKLTSKIICQTMAAVYLDENSVAPLLRSDFAQGVLKILNDKEGLTFTPMLSTRHVSTTPLVESTSSSSLLSTSSTSTSTSATSLTTSSYANGLTTPQRLKRGYLNKFHPTRAGIFFDKWTPRYFLLCDGHLRYYLTKEEADVDSRRDVAEPRGKMYLPNQCEAVMEGMVPGKSDTLGVEGKFFTFKVINKKTQEEYRLSADDEDNGKDWLALIREWCNFAPTPGSIDKSSPPSALSETSRKLVALPESLTSSLTSSSSSSSSPSTTTLTSRNSTKTQYQMVSSFTVQPLTEPTSGTVFQPKMPNGDVLMGAGCRVKTVMMMDFNVYAIGLYVDAAPAAESLQQFKNKTSLQLSQSQEFYDDVMSGDFRKSFRLVMLRTVSAANMIDGLKEGVGSRIPSAFKEAIWVQMNRMMTSCKIEQGTILDFEISNNNQTYQFYCDGELKGTIESPEFCKAICETYMDSNPISNSAKFGFATNFSSLIENALKTAVKQAIPTTSNSISNSSTSNSNSNSNSNTSTTKLADAVDRNVHHKKVSYSVATLVFGSILIGSGLAILLSKQKKK